MATQLNHYLTVTQLQKTNASETLFKTTITEAIDKLLKIGRRIVRTITNKKYYKNGVWRLTCNKTFHKEIEPKKKCFRFLGHLMRT